MPSIEKWPTWAQNVRWWWLRTWGDWSYFVGGIVWCVLVPTYILALILLTIGQFS